MSDGDLTVAAGPLSLTLRPAWGGRVAAFAHARFGAILVPIAERTFVPEAWPKAGAYPLIPFHNRISNGAFMFEGRRIEIPEHPEASPHALHGFSSRREWRVAGCGADWAELVLRHEGDAFWPWPVTCRQVFRLTPDALEVTLSVSNDSDRPMPAGIGWHPYFLKATRVEEDSAWIWPLRSDYRPVGERRPRSADEGPTRYLSGWSRVEAAFGFRREAAAVRGTRALASGHP